MSCIYIPLCFYFIHPQGAVTIVCPIIYIPLCFYFICKKTGSQKTNLHLHSTMLLLYPRCYRAESVLHPHLHSTMLLLYLEIRCNPSVPCHIYIPLCFYFIGETKKAKEYLMHLHSTMLLLYPIPKQSIHTSVYIYIPLCFYFIPPALRRHILRSHLHSTMLLLYRIHFSYSLSGPLSFTFHYASTLSCRPPFLVFS